MKAIHKMTLAPEPFAMIKSGRKTIELRLYDEKRRKISVGDTIEFTHGDTGEKMLATVKALHVFESFAQLFENLPLLECGYTEENVSRAKPEDMNVYYSPERRKEYGALGIEISLCGKHS